MTVEGRGLIVGVRSVFTPFGILGSNFVVRLGSRGLYPLSHLTDLKLF